MSDEKEKKILQINQQTAARLSALFLLLMLGAFVVGYFMGQRHALQDGIQVLQKESLADEVYANAFAIKGLDKEPLHFDEEERETSVEQAIEENNESPELQSELYFASLIGYNVRQKKIAEAFV